MSSIECFILFTILCSSFLFFHKIGYNVGFRMGFEQACKMWKFFLLNDDSIDIYIDNKEQSQ